MEKLFFNFSSIAKGGGVVVQYCNLSCNWPLLPTVGASLGSDGNVQPRIPSQWEGLVTSHVSMPAILNASPPVAMLLKLKQLLHSKLLPQTLT